MTLSRRALLESLAPWGILALLVRKDALAAPARLQATKFLAEVDEATRALAAHRIEPREWQDRAAALAREVDVADLQKPRTWIGGRAA